MTACNGKDKSSITRGRPWRSPLCFLLALLFVAAAASPCRCEDRRLMELRTGKTPRLEQDAVEIARNAVAGRLSGAPLPAHKKQNPLLARPFGVFVTITRNGKVRGCMGTVEPHEPDAAGEISRSAVMAATIDPWHRPIARWELPHLRYIISIVGSIRQVQSEAQVDPVKYGVLVRRGERSALLLPGEALTAHWALFRCRQKAGIPQDEKVDIFIFETVTLGPGR